MLVQSPKSKTVSNPNAWIVTNNQKDKSKPSDRGRKSIKNGKVYLKDGQEFEIELYNPLKESVLAKINLNGKQISNNGLVLRPGERVYLDCFLDDKKKFIFKTYEVDNSNESMNAISNNGLLEVFFYKESVIISNDNWYNLNDWYNKFNNSKKYNQYPYDITFTTCYNGDIEISNNNALYSSIGTTTNIETGRVEKGSKSDQKFEYVDMKFENYYISSTKLIILPESRMPIEAKDIKKNKEPKNIDSDKDHLIDLIKKLSDLHKSGILTDDEFNYKKAELLSKI
jgi:hypothetical protein